MLFGLRWLNGSEKTDMNNPIYTLGGIQTSGNFGFTDEIEHLSGRGHSLRIVQAVGGVIVAVKNEDNHANKSDLYVIHDTENLGEKIGQILTLHYLRKT